LQSLPISLLGHLVVKSPKGVRFGVILRCS